MNTLYQRYTLHLRTQTSNETVEEYASEIRRLAESCEFGIEKESRIRDYVLFGLNNRQISLSIIKRGGDPKLNEIFGWFLPLECQINVNVIPSVQPKIESNQNFDSKISIDLIELQPDDIKEEFKNEYASDADAQNNSDVQSNSDAQSNQHSDSDDDFTWKEEPATASKSIDTYVLIPTQANATHSAFVCKICKKQYLSEAELNFHIATYHEKNKKQCQKCNKTFRCPSLLLVHLKYSDRDHKSLTCPACRKVYFVENSLNNHIRLYHPQVLYANEKKPMAKSALQCKHCDRLFATAADLQLHNATHQGKCQNMCDQCNKSFRCASLLRVHLNYINADHSILTCPTCMKTFTVASTLSNHIRTHHPEILPGYDKKILAASAFKCRHCSKPFATVADLELHNETHQGRCQNMCEQCKKTFRCPSLLRAHLKYSDPDHSSLTCPTCAKTFMVESSLINHIRTFHPETLPGFVKREYECYLCAKKFMHDMSLRGHMVTSHLRRRAKNKLCPQCGNCFTSINALNLHLMRADHRTASTIDVRRFKCKYCDKTFSQKAALMDHESIHTGERRHECFCGKRFASRTNLYTHRLTHETEKRLHCQLCDYKCDIPRTLRKHMKIHTVGD